MAVKTENLQPRIRADETSRKTGITFNDLCELVDRGREAGVDQSAPIFAETWSFKNAPSGRKGVRVRFLEV
jgi:hypothetical protein